MCQSWVTPLMSPLAPIPSPAAKLFVNFYTFYSAVAFLTVAAVLVAPVVNRLLHRFHLNMYADAPLDGSPAAATQRDDQPQ